MTDRALIREQLYRKYIEPTKKKKDNYIGIEIELPIVNLEKTAVSFDTVHHVTDLFLEHFGFEAEGVDSDGKIYAAKDPVTGDILSFDCSYNNLELSLGKGKELHSLHERFCRYYSFLQEEFGRFHHMLTGMGINPYRIYNHNIPIKNERYQMLFRHLGSYKDYFNSSMYFHRHPNFGAFSCASQVQLDVTEDNLLTVIRAFSRLEPIKALLFSNSVLLEEREDLLCCRDMMWENSTHGINPHNIGMFEKLPETEEELLSYIESTSMYCVERDGKYINFPPMPLLEFFNQESVTGEWLENGTYQKTSFRPELSDLQYLRSFKFEDLTFRGTIEFRSGCCQPAADAMTIAAFHTGLMENLEQLDALMEKDTVLYHHGYQPTELRKMFNQRIHPAFVDEDALYQLAEQILTLASDGLKKRELGEEVYLQPLFERIRTRQNPAEHLLRQRESGVPLEDIILAYGRLK